MREDAAIAENVSLYVLGQGKDRFDDGLASACRVALRFSSPVRFFRQGRKAIGMEVMQQEASP